jgi:chromosomal replication initiation ATPase DnaA
MSPIEIAKFVANEMKIPFEKLMSPKRDRELVDCRRMISLILQEKSYPMSTICHVLKKDRKTIAHQLETIQSLMDVYPTMRKQYQIIKEKVNETQTH